MAKKDSKEVIYCIYCGAKNKIGTTTCKKCGKNLNEEKSLLKEYLFTHINDKFIDDATNSLFQLIGKYIRSHLMGVFSIATILFTATSVILNILADDNYELKVVESKPVFLDKSVVTCLDDEELVGGECVKIQNRIDVESSSNDRCSTLKGKKPSYSCDSSYSLINNMCVKKTYSAAVLSSSCPSGYNEVGDTCLKAANKSISGGSCTMNNNIMIAQGLDPSKDYIHFAPTYNQSSGKCDYTACINAVFESDNLVDCADFRSGSFDPINQTVTCEDGAQLINENCFFVANKNNGYVCSNGTLTLENKCLTETKEQPKLTCGKGYKLDRECNICVK